jgi:putative ABC transport system permease protein
MLSVHPAFYRTIRPGRQQHNRLVASRGVKFASLVWAGIARRPLRSLFTLVSMTIAFLLFGMLQGINFGYAAIVEQQLLDRLITDPKVPGGAPMPISMKQKIEALPGVRRVCARGVFFGYYQDPRQRFAALATSAEDFLAVRPEFRMDAATVQALRDNRNGIAMTPALLRRFGLKRGDAVPVVSPIARLDGNPVWSLILVGTFDYVDDPGQNELGLINYEYFDAARAGSTGTVDRFIIRIADPRRSAAMAMAIDSLFANSPAETRTQNEKDQVESSIQQLGDVSFFTNSIVAAVFFALLFLTGNTMAQSVRERTAEIAVLETIGYSRRRIAAIVLVEATLPALLAAAIGLAIAAALFPGLREIIGLARLSWSVVAWGALAALLVGCASALIPVWRISRMSIVAALGYRG